MPGNGPHQPFADKVLEEMRAALRLLFRQTEVLSVPLALDVPSCRAWSPTLTGRVHALPVAWGGVAVRDPLAALSQCATRTPPPLPDRGHLQSIPCAWEARVTEAPTFSTTEATLHSVLFDGLTSPSVDSWYFTPLEAPQAPALSIPSLRGQVATTQTPWKGIATRIGQKAPLHQPSNRRVRPMSETQQALPWLRAPLPVHRFSPDLKERFRQALAEKARTQPENIALVRIYDRIPVSAFQSFSIDDRGNLLGFPKVPAPRRLDDPPVMYLVFGTRRDTQETLQTFVPPPTPGGRA